MVLSHAGATAIPHEHPPAMTTSNPNSDESALRTVGAVAEATGVSVRTLHHYDDIGLLCPSMRSPTGYRLYSTDDIVRLQQILTYRQLGFTLEQVADLLHSVGADLPARLEERLTWLRQEQSAIATSIQLLTTLLNQLSRGEPMADEDFKQALNGLPNAPESVRDQYTAHSDEVKARWETTDAYAEAERRMRGHSKGDWAHIQQEQERLEVAMARLAADGLKASGDEARALAEEMRLHIDRSYYACSREMHSALADMYVSDPRFRAHYDKRHPGLADYIAEAIRANAGATP
jgi:DNA-binding transcriptional MerR regulator